MGRVRRAIIIISVLAVAAAAIIVAVFALPAEAPQVPIESQFENKIVYGTSGDLDANALKRDCDARGGTFNTCGSVCPSDAEVCIQVCAYTCELKK